MCINLKCDVIAQMHLQMISSECPQGYVSARQTESFRPNQNLPPTLSPATFSLCVCLQIEKGEWSFNLPNRLQIKQLKTIFTMVVN